MKLRRRNGKGVPTKESKKTEVSTQEETESKPTAEAAEERH
jgi:hypothetical protein